MGKANVKETTESKGDAVAAEPSLLNVIKSKLSDTETAVRATISSTSKERLGFTPSSSMEALMILMIVLLLVCTCVCALTLTYPEKFGRGRRNSIPDEGIVPGSLERRALMLDSKWPPAPGTGHLSPETRNDAYYPRSGALSPFQTSLS